jgi:ankyrin repeat protein
MFLFFIFCTIQILSESIISSQQSVKSSEEILFNYNGLNKSVHQAIRANDFDNFQLHMQTIPAPVLPEFKDIRGNNLCYKAVEYDRIEMLDEIIKKENCDINNQNHNGDTPIHCAVLKKNICAFEKLKNAGAHLDMKNQEGMTPFALAVKNDDRVIVSLLLFSGKVDVRSKNMYGNEPIHFAKSPFMVHQLVIAGANVNAPGLFGHTPIVYAVKNNRLLVFHALRNQGARVDYIDKETDKNLLSFTKSPEFVSVLTTLLADLNVQNKENRASLDFLNKYRDLNLTESKSVTECKRSKIKKDVIIHGEHNSFIPIGGVPPIAISAADKMQKQKGSRFFPK